MCVAGRVLESNAGVQPAVTHGRELRSELVEMKTNVFISLKAEGEY